MNFRAMMCGLLGLVGLTTAACADSTAHEDGDGALKPEISVLEARQAQLDGDIILIDVRRPGEWESTGLPQGAARATLQDDDFIAQVEAIVAGRRDAQIAFTCRTGDRSKTARDRLRAAGYSNVTSVSGGLLGRNGWKRAGLPLMSLAQADCASDAPEASC
jgi:rhodanese-related sulfurtransferase